MNRSAWGLAFVLSISGCTCEYHAGTGVSTHSGGERTAADIERERYERERWERERAARDAERAARERMEWERRNNPRHVSGGVHVTGRRTETRVSAPPAPPVTAPPGAAPAHPAQPVHPPHPPAPVGAPPVVSAPPAAREVAQPSAPAPAAPPAAAPAAPPPKPSDNYVRARTPRSRETSGAQRAGEAGDKVEQEQRRRVRRGSLEAQ